MSTPSKQEFVDIFPVFRGGTDGLVEDILAVSSLKGFQKGTRLYTEGDACPAIAFLLSGEVRVYKVGETGREITLYEFGRGETCILNASCILSRIPYPAEAETIADGEMLLLPAPEFKRTIGSYEAMREFICSILSRRITSMMTLIEEVAFGKMDDRLMDYIIEKSEDGKLYSTHQRIAADLGTSREVVSRLLKEFERRGRVSLSRNLVELLRID
ncbi:MAG: Crp/Fnr family transcriptional regulator [Chloroflexota bacterium]